MADVNELEENLKNSPDVAKQISEFLDDPSTGVLWDKDSRKSMHEDEVVNLDEDVDDDGPYEFDDDEEDDEDDDDEEDQD